MALRSGLGASPVSQHPQTAFYGWTWTSWQVALSTVDEPTVDRTDPSWRLKPWGWACSPVKGSCDGHHVALGSTTCHPREFPGCSARGCDR